MISSSYYLFKDFVVLTLAVTYCHNCPLRTQVMQPYSTLYVYGYWP